MLITEMDREWVTSLAGREVSDEEVVEFLVEYNDWLDSNEISPEIYAGN